MTTVASRTIRSTPFRDAVETWDAIVSLLTVTNRSAKAELQDVTGIAASVIADLTLRDAPLVVTCNGPRTRIYCLYNEDAIEGADAQEDVLGFDPLQGEWAISLPCHADDLSWIRAALAKQSARITARDQVNSVVEAPKSEASEAVLSIDRKKFFGL